MWKDFDKEKPTKSGEYVTVLNNGLIINLHWSQKHQCFNVRDSYADTRTAISDILYWAYLDDVCPKDSRLYDTAFWNERGTNK